MVITIITSNLYLYIFITLLTIFLLLKTTKKFEKESILEYCIYLTNKVILLVMFISFLIISILCMIGIQETEIIYFIQELSNMLLYYALFNYSIFYSIKLIGWAIDFFKKNELLSFSLLKKGAEK